MTQWSHMPPAEIARIVSVYTDSGQGSPQFRQEAHKMGIKEDTLGRYVRFFNTNKRLVENEAIPLEEPPLIETYTSLPTYHTQPRLTDITNYNKNTDTERWLDWLVGRQKNDPILSMMHMCDIHMPFQDDHAVDVAMQMAQMAQPDLIVVGSDFWDFYLLSYFGTDPEVSKNIGDYDELDELERAWNVYIHQVKQAAPKAQLVYIYGNHERRIIRHLLSNAVNVSRTVLRAFHHVIQCGGSVMYVGDVDHIRLGPLQVEHGVSNTRGEHHCRDKRFNTSWRIGLGVGRSGKLQPANS